MTDSAIEVNRIAVDGQRRRGTGTVTIDEIESTGPCRSAVCSHSIPGHTRPPSDPLHRARSLTDPLFTVAISAVDGTLVWSGNSLDTVAQRTCAAGTGSVGFEISSLPLAGGDFILSAAINDVNSQLLIDYVKDIARLQVAPHRRNESGYISIDGEWIPLVSDR